MKGAGWGQKVFDGDLGLPFYSLRVVSGRQKKFVGFLLVVVIVRVAVVRPLTATDREPKRLSLSLSLVDSSLASIFYVI